MSQKSGSSRGSIKIIVRDAAMISQAIGQLPALHDAKVSYALGYIANKCDMAVRQFERERAKIQREMSQPTKVNRPDGVEVTIQQVPPDKHAEFSSKIEEMQDKEFTIDRAPVLLKDVIGPNNDVAGKLAPGLLSRLQNVIIE